MNKKKFQSLLDPDAEILVWGPIPGAVYYTSVFLKPFAIDYAKEYEGIWPPTVILFRGGNIVWFNGYPELRAEGRRAFLRYVLPRDEGKKNEKMWRKTINDLQKKQQLISEDSLRTCTNIELKKAAQDYYLASRRFMVPTIAPEVGNYGADVLLEEKLLEFIDDANERALALEVLTAPEGLSFHQEEEIDLAETDDIEEHQQKYSWLKNSYGRAEILPTRFFVERKNKLGKNIRKEFEKKIKSIRKKKQQVKDKHGLSSEVMDIAEGICSSIVLQDERKKHQAVIIQHIRLIADEVALRFDYSINELLLAWHEEVLEIIEGKNLKNLLKERRSGSGVEFDDKGMRELTSSQVDRYWKLYVDRDKIGDDKELRGIVASRGDGVIKGKVRVVLDPHNADLFEDGEILVTAMTSPEYIFVMRKAAAIITDRGGLTSHAAIVSRELGIPCILNTKVATKIFKDGDMVEVDADNGVVRIIKKSNE